MNADYEINPMFYKGIFFTDGATKGDTIKLFNKVLKVNSIVLIDYAYDHLNSMRIFCECAGVNFLGIHFKGGERLPGIYNNKLAKFQEKNLIENRIWLEDEKAEKFID